MKAVTCSSDLAILNLAEVLFAPLQATPRLLCTKTIDWAYEREYRLIDFSLASEGEVHRKPRPLPNGLKI